MPDAAYRVMSLMLKVGIYGMLILIYFKLDRIVTLLERAQWLTTNLLK